MVNHVWGGSWFTAAWSFTTSFVTLADIKKVQTKISSFFGASVLVCHCTKLLLPLPHMFLRIWSDQDQQHEFLGCLQVTPSSTRIWICETWISPCSIWVLCYNGLNLQRFVWGKTLIEIISEIALLFFLLPSCFSMRFFLSICSCNCPLFSSKDIMT